MRAPGRGRDVPNGNFLALDPDLRGPGTRPAAEWMETQGYNSQVNKAMVRARTREEALDVLAHLRADMESGRRRWGR